MKTNDFSVTQFIKENFAFVAAVAVTIFNLYITSLLLPIKSDIRAVAGQVDQNTERCGSIENIKITTSENSILIREMKDDVLDIKEAAERIEERLNTHLVND